MGGWLKILPAAGLLIPPILVKVEFGSAEFVIGSKGLSFRSKDFWARLFRLAFPAAVFANELAVGASNREPPVLLRTLPFLS